MKHLTFLVATICLLFASCSSEATSSLAKKTPSGEIDTTSLSLPDITGIHTSVGLNIYYTVTKSNFNARIIAPADFLPYINVETKKDELYCSVKSDCPFRNYGEKTNIYIEGPALSTIGCFSSSRLEFLNLMTIDSDVRINTSSSAQLIISLRAPKLELHSSSSSAATMAANTATAVLSASSSASVNAAINASENVVATSTSSSTIKLEGETRQAQYIASSSGHINAKALQALTGSASASSSASIRSSIKNLTSKLVSSSGTVENN